MAQVTAWTMLRLGDCDSVLEAWTAEMCEKDKLHVWKYFKSVIHFERQTARWKIIGCKYTKITRGKQVAYALV